MAKVFAALTLLCVPAYAWGSLGHRTVAEIGYNLIQPTTQSFIDQILAYKDGRDISDAAIWPDQIRHFRPETAQWHYIDARDSPPQSCQINYPDDCLAQESGSCIITAIKNQTALFVDPNISDLIRQEALKFIIHFIGDLHQPLHTENIERGGNGIGVCWKKACARTNLHGIWDTQIPVTAAGIKGHPDTNQERANARQWADELLAKGAAHSTIDISKECANVNDPDECTLPWAREANKINCDYVFQPSIEELEGKDLSLDYYEGAKPIVESQITSAGVRLGSWLEAIVKELKNNQASQLNQEQKLEF